MRGGRSHQKSERGSHSLRLERWAAGSAPATGGPAGAARAGKDAAGELRCEASAESPALGRGSPASRSPSGRPSRIWSKMLTMPSAVTCRGGQQSGQAHRLGCMRLGVPGEPHGQQPRFSTACTGRRHASRRADEPTAARLVSAGPWDPAGSVQPSQWRIPAPQVTLPRLLVSPFLPS